MYGFPRKGEGLASPIDCYLNDQFSNPVNFKDGFALSNYKDVRGHRILEFLDLILYPKNPTQITIIVENTIFGALSKDRKVDWATVIGDVVQKLVFKVEKPKTFSIYPYVFYLYHWLDPLKREEITAY